MAKRKHTYERASRKRRAARRVKKAERMMAQAEQTTDAPATESKKTQAA